MFDIRARSSNKNNSKCLAVKLRTVQIIRKEFEESNGDYEGTAARETHSRSARSDEKRTSESVGEIKTMINNEPS